MASEERTEGRPADVVTLLKDHGLMNAVIRLLTPVSGAGCLGFAGYQAVTAPAPPVTAGFLLAGVVLLFLALVYTPSS